jgi:DNA-binding CsgD family transcriptional regulator
MSYYREGNPVGPDRLLGTLEQLLAIDTTELQSALRQAARVICEVLSADKVDVFVYDPASESLVARGTSATPMGRRQHEIGMDRLPLAGHGRAVEVFRTGTSHHDGRVDEDQLELVGIREGLGVRSQVTVPLEVGGTRRGVLSAVSAEPDFFSDLDTAFLQAVSRWTGLIMHRAELAEVVVQPAEERGRRETLERLLGRLTARQLDVAVLIANGFSNQQIAEQLVLTPGTVANHVGQVLDRLDLNSRTQVATLIAELGLHRQSQNDGMVAADGTAAPEDCGLRGAPVMLR